MSGKSNTLSSQLLGLLFNAVGITGLAVNATASPLTNLWVSLHTADPTDAGTAQSSEITYPGYARVSVARTAGGWTITGSSVAPAANVDFPTCSGAFTGTATFFGVTTAASGASALLYSGAITPALDIEVGSIPRLTTATAITET